MATQGTSKLATATTRFTIVEAAKFIDTHIAFFKDDRKGVRRELRLGAFTRGWKKGASQTDGERSLQSLTWHNLGNRFRRSFRSEDEHRQYDVEQVFDAFWQDFEQRGQRPRSTKAAHLRVVYNRSAITAALVDPKLSTKPSKTYYVVSQGGQRVDMRSLGIHIHPRWGASHTDGIARCLMEEKFVVRCPTRHESYEKKFRRFIENGYLCFDDEEVSEAAAERRRRVWRSVINRPGQGRFREALLHAYGRQCAMSGADHELVLQAAHIQSVEKNGRDEVRNGLLLRADLHLLFDAALIAVDVNDWSILVHPSLHEYGARLVGRKLTLPKRKADRPSAELLIEHRRIAGL